jgi:hypothetical protein
LYQDYGRSFSKNKWLEQQKGDDDAITNTQEMTVINIKSTIMHERFDELRQDEPNTLEARLPTWEADTIYLYRIWDRTLVMVVSRLRLDMSERKQRSSSEKILTDDRYLTETIGRLNTHSSLARKSYKTLWNWHAA